MLVESLSQMINQKEMINFLWFLLYSCLAIVLFIEIHLSESLKGINKFLTVITMIFAIVGIIVVVKLPDHANVASFPMLVSYFINHIINGVVYWKKNQFSNIESKLRFSYKIITFLGVLVTSLFITQFELGMRATNNTNTVTNNKREISNLKKEQISLKKRVGILEIQVRVGE